MSKNNSQIKPKSPHQNYINKNMEMIADNNFNVTSNNIVVKVEPNLSEDTFDYDLPCTQTLPQYAFNEIKIEYDDGVDQRNKCNVASHIVNIKVEQEISDDIVNYNSESRQPLSQHDPIKEMKAECNDVVNLAIAKLEDEDMEYRLPICNDYETNDIKNKIREIITPEHCNKKSHELINQNVAYDNAVVDSVEHDNAFLDDDYSSDNELPLAETIQTAESCASGVQQRTTVPDDSTLIKDDSRGDLPSDGGLTVNDNLTCEIISYPTNGKCKMWCGLKAHNFVDFTILKTREQPSFPCQICHRTFTRKDSLAIHMTSHPQEKPFQCDICHKTFSRKHTLATHMRIHSGEKPFQCKICHKLFSENSKLTTHLRIHSGTKPFSCKVCYKAFTEKGNLTSHMRTHLSEKPYPCEVCHKKFTRKNQLTSHMRSHSGEKPFLCEICHKTFIEEGKLARHMRTHSGEKPFPCEVCQKTFTEKGTLTRHMRTHLEEKPFQCEVCYKTFTQKCHLVSHMSTHSGEKPFQCEVCYKLFCEKGNLTTHMRKHFAEKQFPCKVCNKTFTRKNRLLSHIRTHSGEKPFPCDVCQKPFTEKDSLTKHTRTHSGV